MILRIRSGKVIGVRIAFDGQLFLKGDKTGVGWCAESMMKCIGRYREVEKQLNYFSLGYTKESRAALQPLQELGYELTACGWFHDAAYRMIWNDIRIPYSCFFGKKPDITVFFNFIVPPGVHGRTIAFVHDMAYQAFPDTVRKKTRHYLEGSMEKSCQRADKIIVISEFTRMELQKYLSVPEDKIEVIPLGVDRSRFHPFYSGREIEDAKARYGIASAYLLYIGTIEPRKNIERLLRAYALLKMKTKQVPELVLAGKKGWLYQDIFRTVEELGLADCVRFTGYVADGDLPRLLCGAQAFVFPSVYEGFGLPILEAMACGVPVVTSDTASMPETAGDAAVLADPTDPGSICDAMLMLLQDAEQRHKLSEAGLKRARRYTWEKAADRFLEVCNGLHCRE